MDKLFQHLIPQNETKQQENINLDTENEKEQEIEEVKMNLTEQEYKILDTEPPKKEKRKQYINTFMIKNKGRISEKIICEVCKGTYTYFNKNKHTKTKRHNLFMDELNKNNI